MANENRGARSGFEQLTAAEPAALAGIRVFGSAAAEFLRGHLRGRVHSGVLSAGSLHRAEFVDADGAAIDDVVVSVHATVPGLDVRIHFHGGTWPIGRCRELLRAAGFEDMSVTGDAPPLWPVENEIERIAWRMLPGFSTRAGSRWLARQARALPNALRRLAAGAAAYDAAHADADDDGRGDPIAAAELSRTIAALLDRAKFAQWFAVPLRIALVGPPNAGKSTLINALAGEAVSLVAPIAGTTRDWVEAPGEIAGYPVVWIDTAGLRDSSDAVEVAGVASAREIISAADAALAVLDGCDPAAPAFLDTSRVAPTCIAANKYDAPGFRAEHIVDALQSRATPVVAVSARTGGGLDALRSALLAACGRVVADDEPAAFAPEIAAALAEWSAGSPARLAALLARP